MSEPESKKIEEQSFTRYVETVDQRWFHGHVRPCLAGNTGNSRPNCYFARMWRTPRRCGKTLAPPELLVQLYRTTISQSPFSCCYLTACNGLLATWVAQLAVAALTALLRPIMLSQPQFAAGSLLVNMESIRQGVSGKAAQLNLASWRPSTEQQYATYFGEWLQFCCEKQIGHLRPPLIALEILADLYDSGYSCTVHCQQREFQWTNLHLVDISLWWAFMKGLYNERVPVPRHQEIWDP